jgi:hypothetical protein
MYFAIALICGLDPSTPKAVEGCVGLAAPHVMVSKEECITINTLFEEGLNLPEGAYLVETKCILVERTL